MSHYYTLGGDIGRLTPHQAQTLRETDKNPVVMRLYTSGPLSALRSKGLVEIQSARQAFPNDATDDNKSRYGVITDKGRLAVQEMDKLDQQVSETLIEAVNDEEATDQMNLFEEG